MKSKEEVKAQFPKAQAKVDAAKKAAPKGKQLEPAGAPNLDEIIALARRQVQIEEAIEDLQNSLKDLCEMHKRISEEDLPAAMAEAQMAEFTMEDGTKIKIKPDFAVTLTNEMKPRAYEWLESHGHGGLIRTQLIVEFGKGELEKALQLAAVLEKKKLSVAVGQDVNWQSLKAFIKEQDAKKDEIKKADRVPMDIFGAHPLTKSIIKLPKF